MTPGRIVERFDPVEHRRRELETRRPFLTVEELGLHPPPKRLDPRTMLTVERVTDRAKRVHEALGTDLLRERPRERLLPWSKGEVDQAALWEADRFFQIVKTLVAASIKPAPLLFCAGILTAFAAYGLKTTLAPIFAVQVLSWPQETFGYVAGVAALVGGVFGLVASGYLTDRLGSSRTIVGSLGLMSLLHGGMAYAASYWAAPGLFAVYYLLHAVVFVLLSVSIYSTAMALSHSAVAATHFAAFMALLNFGTSWGAQWFVWIESSWGYVGVFYSASAYCLLALALFAGSSHLTRRN